MMFYSIDDVAKRAQLSRSAIVMAVDSGRIIQADRTVGGIRLLESESVDRFLAARDARPAAARYIEHGRSTATA
jgi:hypothetical protein